jgi:hypothetical protein
MAKEGTITHTTLLEMGHPQDATKLTTHNPAADGIINGTIQQKRVNINGHAVLLDQGPGKTKTI